MSPLPRREQFHSCLKQGPQREINELKIHCIHHWEGCQWIGKQGNLQTHLNKVCGYVRVECTNKCKLHGEVRKFERKCLRDHL